MTDPNPRTLATVKERSAGVCEFPRCSTPAAHTHHRDPRGMGGTRDPGANLAGNLLRLCGLHHDWIERHREVAYEFGWLVHTGVNPTTVPVLLRTQAYGVAWVLLSDLGHVTWIDPDGHRLALPSDRHEVPGA